MVSWSYDTKYSKVPNVDIKVFNIVGYFISITSSSILMMFDFNIGYLQNRAICNNVNFDQDLITCQANDADIKAIMMHFNYCYVQYWYWITSTLISEHNTSISNSLDFPKPAGLQRPGTQQAAGYKPKGVIQWLFLSNVATMLLSPMALPRSGGAAWGQDNGNCLLARLAYRSFFKFDHIQVELEGFLATTVTISLKAGDRDIDI
jgi:hypothetical protein